MTVYFVEEFDDWDGFFDREGLKKRALADRLLPFFKEFLLHSKREAIVNSIEKGEENTIIEHYILEVSNFMSLEKDEQIVYLEKCIEAKQSLVGEDYFKELFEAAIVLVEQ